jgi:hypothetical protein
MEHPVLNKRQKTLNGLRKRLEISKDISPLIGISDDFIDKTLKLYKQHSKYLKSAEVYYGQEFSDKDCIPDSAIVNSRSDLATIIGSLSITSNSYSDETICFNVEQFSISYNQLIYILLGQCIFYGHLNHPDANCYGKLNLSFSKYFKQQLFSLIILKVDINFYKPLNCNNFNAQLTIKNINWNGETAAITTQITFWDALDKKADGTVELVLKAYNGL